MRAIEFRPRASADLDGILASIALTLKSPQAARGTADAIFAAIERAAEIPELGQPFFDEDLEPPAQAREAILGVLHVHGRHAHRAPHLPYDAGHRLLRVRDPG